jgi:putative aminopeptidase FrvX
VKAFVADRPRLKLRKDAIGNLLIELAGKSRGPRTVFSAHMDHPGLRALEMMDDRTVLAAFHGWVQIDYVRGTRVRFFDGDTEITGTIIDATADEHDRLAVPKQVKVRVNKPVPAGSPGMFDQGVGRVKGGKFFCRALDDLAGVAGALDMLDQLERRPPKATIAVILTRAEEEGFIGCIGAVLKPTLLKKTDRIIGIECSAEQPYAKQGDGVILRVGDRTSIFNSQLTYFLNAQAAELAKTDKTFKYQRALMPGGTCESTVYDAYGYTAAAVCVPLGNYHNMDKSKKKIGPEYINVNDWNNMVKLFVQIAKNAHTFEPGMKPLKDRIAKRYQRFAGLLVGKTRTTSGK